MVDTILVGNKKLNGRIEVVGTTHLLLCNLSHTAAGRKETKSHKRKNDDNYFKFLSEKLGFAGS